MARQCYEVTRLVAAPVAESAPTQLRRIFDAEDPLESTPERAALAAQTEAR